MAPRRSKSPRAKRAKRAAAPKNLREYQRKRDFQVTPEPAPTPPRPQAGAPTFMVHKHDATRLHYDLRLEMDGALASWAVPKGPSYDPSARRLAVQTEDHPLEYGHFEGRIPDGEYGAGDSLIWDRGTYDTVPPGQASAQRKKGHLVIELHGEKLDGRWHLVRTRPVGGKAQWLLFKAKDGKENPAYDVIAERPESVVSGRALTRGPVRKTHLRAVHQPPETLLQRVWPPMLATLGEVGDVDEATHLLEVKYDGFRGLAALSGGKLVFHSRNGIDLSGRFPEIAKALGRLVIPEAVLDGEVVAFDAHGVSRFELLQQGGVDHRFVAFDLLWLDGQDLRARPLEERRQLLESVLANAPPPLMLAERVLGTVDEALEEARRRGSEGVIAKLKGAPYEGRRSTDWIKLKANASQEVAIVGFLPISTGAKELGALLIAVHDGRGFRFAGKVGTGYTAKVRRELYKRLREDRVDEPEVSDAPRIRDAVWVKPRLVAQVRFTEWTRDGKLRHPAFLGLREDKRPEETRKEERPAHVVSHRHPRTGRRTAPKLEAARHVVAPKMAEPVNPDALLTSPERLIFPKARLHKRDVFEYYRQVAEVMVPALLGRPVALKQWPKGVGADGFFRQNVRELPSWATRAKVSTLGGAGEAERLIVDRPETLLWLANRSALELHAWHSRVPHLTEPDWVVFDLDPGKGTFADLIAVAEALHRLLDQLGLQSVPKTSGKRGLHVLVPISRGHTYEDTRRFALALAGALGQALPEIATVERSISKRKGRLYVDAEQNGLGKTIVAPYSLRGTEAATVSAPLRWSEVTKKLDPASFNLKTMRRRLDKVGDLFAPALNGTQRLPRLG